MRSTASLLFAAVCVLGSSPKSVAADKVLRFEGSVASILQAKCARCHGTKGRKADLNLTTARGVLAGGESGPVVVPGEPEKSLLYERLRIGEMPPDKKNRPTPEEIELIRRWIAAGAKFESPASAGREVTQHDVIPLLNLRCTVCHGRRRQEADLDLRTKAAMLRGGKSGPAFVPGKPAKSLILKRIHAGAMPPRRLVVSVSVKPMEPAEIELLTQWIREGAPESPVRPDVATTKPDPLVSDKDRQFWAFQTPRAVKVPGVEDGYDVHNPIDAFLLSKLQSRGLTLSPEADRLTLLRRATFDLTGLPPTPCEIASYLGDRSPGAYERMIDRLLASPRYGERWGRHWLDLAGYADSEGVQDSDQLRPHAWRYRDYVVRAFNDDKPYDRFLLEQIAGDELADYENAKVITPEIYDNLVATGFLRMAIDGTFADITNFLPDRLATIDREVEVLTSSVMGLTMKCARCHSHKFDPIPQRDYYRLLAVFKGALDEHDWLKPLRQEGSPGENDRLLPYVTTTERQAWEAHARRISEEIARLKKQPKSKDTDARIKDLESLRKPEPLIRALWDRGEPSPTYILKRGNYLTPGRPVGPGVPSVLTDGKTPFDAKPPFPGSSKTGRRLGLARWLTRGDHPLTARVMVNRIWHHHFGRGLVTTLDNFGKAGAAPTHPRLLDWLAVEFVRRGWSIKSMHRLMMTSAAYRQSSRVTPRLQRLDPENRLLSRMPLRRMDAETLRDSLIFLAGRLAQRPYGPGDPVTVRGDGLVTSLPTHSGWRRSIYVLQRRMQIPTILENFDLPRMTPNCIERSHSTVAPQSLHLMNNGFVDQLAGHFAERVLKEAGRDAARQVELAQVIALGRQPTGESLRISTDALNKLRTAWRAELPKAGQDEVAHKALKNLCRGIVNSAAFLYID